MRVNKDDIGKYYYPIDNSYVHEAIGDGSCDINLVNKGYINDYEVYLAGHTDKHPELVQIVSTPYNITLVTIVSSIKTEEFVNVLYNNKIYAVLNCFNNKISNVIPDYI